MTSAAEPEPAPPPDPSDPPDGRIEPLDRIWTLPNVITTGRLLFLPLYWWLLVNQGNRAAAAVLLGLLGATDWCDGYVARHTGQVSKLGKVLDPTADRIMFLVAIVGILIDGAVPRWFCLVVLAREIVVSLITLTITALGARPVEVTWFGKAGTFGLMFAFPLLLIGGSDLSLAPVFTTLGWLIGLPGLGLSYFAAVRYVPLWRQNLHEARLAAG